MMKKMKSILAFASFTMLGFGQSIIVKSPVATGVTPPLSSLTGQVAPANVAGQYDKTRLDKAAMVADHIGKLSAPSLSISGVNTPYQTTLGTLPVTVTKNFQGLGRGYNANWVDQFLLPPDTTMAVGPNHVVQWVNVRLSIMDKNGTPLVGGALGYINGNAIWTGLPANSVCRLNNAGDPILQYDRLANRWILSQFAFAVNSVSPFQPLTPYSQCIAVSTSPDPTGTYTLYDYSFGNFFPDYGKLGVWPDAYYITYNTFDINQSTGATTFTGGQVCAYDRALMIAGNVGATQVCTTRLADKYALLPSDMDGTTVPPANSPNYILSNDWAFIFGPYSLQLQKFHVDFANPLNSTFNDGIGGGFNSFIQIPLNTVVGSCGDNGGNCVTQPGTPRLLDTLSMRPMYRLAYRNRSGVESLIVTQPIDPPGAAAASMHWLELRNPGANPPVVYQNGAINTAGDLNRWMSSGAMDKDGNMAFGYSVSSATVFPSIRIAGRGRADIRNTLRGELEVVTGAGSQTSSAQRWGDYSTMQIDPSDDCTFWFTTEYMSATVTRDWATKIVAFKFPSCQPPPSF